MEEAQKFDDALLHDMVAVIGLNLASSGQEAIQRYLNDDRVTPTMMTMAVVRAHLLGAASMLAASTEKSDPIEVVTWLIEAFAEARSSVGAFAVGAG